MTSKEIKNLCVELYTEGTHTIKEILTQTRLKNALEMYRILDEAGIPRKRKQTKKVVEKSGQIPIEESRSRYLTAMCRVYKGEDENPYTAEEDAFRRYMWRSEWKTLQNADDPKFIESQDLNNPLSWNKFFNSSIKSYIHLWTDTKNGEKDTQWWNSYFQL